MAATKSRKLDLLLAREDQLIDLLKKADIQGDVHKLSEDLFRNIVISKEAKEKFATLDHAHLDIDLKVRYLLRQVYDKVRVDHRAFDRLVRILNKLGEDMKGLCLAMKMEMDNGKEGKASSGNVGDACLTEKDVPGLVDKIVSGSHKWEEIGIALGLPEHVRAECGKGGSDVLKLTNILTAWVRGSCETSKAPTLKTLRAVLGGGIVGLYDLSQTLSVYEYCDKIESKSECSSLDVVPEIVYQSDDTTVDDGRATILMVQVSFEGCESYQWSKDGQPLHIGDDFSDVTNSILYISRARQGTEGKYSCCVSNGREMLYSDKIDVMVLYPPEKERLLEFYHLIESDVPKDTWPPVVNCTFVNLVLIKQSHISKNSYYTIRGDMDDILESKEVVVYDDVFKEYKEGALVLIEGRPGCGKTTLVHKVARDWAAGRSVLQGARIVFLIILRHLNISLKDKSISDILENFYLDVTLRANVEQDLRKSGGKGACFIIDGLDEYRNTNKGSIIYKLIYERYFPSSMVLVAMRPVATRPMASSLLKTTCSPNRIEVLGFSKSQIYQYVQTFEKSYKDGMYSGTIASELEAYLNLHANILHMCYLPVHAAMICYLFCELEGDIPHTETKIYEQFTIATLLRQKMRDTKNIMFKSWRDLRGDDKKCLFKICQLAFTMTINSQQVVSKNDLIALFDDTNFDIDSLGLLTIEHACKCSGIVELYTFLHLTFQEFLAAFYVAETEDFMQRDIFLEYSREDRMKNVWKFYSGLVQYDSITIPVMFGDCDQRHVWPSDPSYKTDRCFGELYKVQCAFESQQNEYCDFVVRNGTFIFDRNIFTGSDFFALSYVISTTSCPVPSLCFKDCHWDRDATSFISIKKEKQEFLTLKFYYVGKGLDESVEEINCVLSQLLFIEGLDITGLRLNESRISNLTKNITLPRLKYLRIPLPTVPISEPENLLKLLRFGSHTIDSVYLNCLYESDHGLCFGEWRKCLYIAFGFQNYLSSDIPWMCFFNIEFLFPHESSRFSCCSYVSIINCGIDDDGANTLAKELNTSVLEKIILDFNRISDPGIAALSACIAKCTVIREISVQCNNISDTGAVVLASVLGDVSSLRKLDLQGSAITNEGAVAIASATETQPKLTLYLCSVYITEEGVQRVLKYKGNAMVRALDFESSSWQAIEEAGIDSMVKALMCGTLPMLKVSRISIEKIKELAMESEHIMNVGGLKCEGYKGILPDLCEIIEAMKNIRVLSLSDVEHGNLDILKYEDLHAIRLYGLEGCDCVEYNSKVQYLNLGCVYFGENIAKSLLDYLKSCADLHTLDLSFCHWDDPHTAKRVLSEALVHCKKLQCLNLSHNHIIDSGISALSVHFTKLRELHLDNNKISYSIRSLAECTHLQLLDLSDNAIESSYELSRILHRNPIRHLNLSGNKIYVEGMYTVCSTLQILKLSNTVPPVPYTNGASNMMIAELVMCRQLVELDISRNGISSHDISKLANGLSCRNLCVLNLSANKITSEGVPAIISIMERCSDLQFLDLSENYIGIDAAVTLVKGWRHNNMLDLNLRSCIGKKYDLHLSETSRCSSTIDRFLKLYYSNDFLIVQVRMCIGGDEITESYIPKKVSF